MARSTATLAWKAFGYGASIAATLLTRALLRSAWKFRSRITPRNSPEVPESHTFQAVSWLLTSAAGAGMGRLLATPQAARMWRKVTGELPPGMEQADIEV